MCLVEHGTRRFDKKEWFGSIVKRRKHAKESTTPGLVKRHTLYIQAVQQGYMQDYDALTRFLADALARGLEEES